MKADVRVCVCAVFTFCKKLMGDDIKTDEEVATRCATTGIVEETTGDVFTVGYDEQDEGKDPIGNMVKSALTEMVNYGPLITIFDVQCIYIWKINSFSGPEDPWGTRLLSRQTRRLLRSTLTKCYRSMFPIDIIKAANKRGIMKISPHFYRSLSQNLEPRISLLRKWSAWTDSNDKNEKRCERTTTEKVQKWRYMKSPPPLEKVQSGVTRSMKHTMHRKNR